MPRQTVDFREDIPAIHKHLAARVKSQAEISDPISAVEIGFQICQAGLIVVHFDTRAKHKRDGSWTVAMEGPSLRVPRWCRAYEAADRHGVSFVLPDGTAKMIEPGVEDADVAGVFGRVLLAVVRDALARDTFEPLKLRKNCQVDIEEFDNMWAWPMEYEDLGRTNLISKIKRARLPG